ncbi:MAG: tetratricopeptide repeat protein [Anaerolineae bacterium]
METYSFGAWLAQRRKALDMTQRDLAERAACGLATIKKIEADERRPSRELAALLAEALQVPTNFRDTFIECARGLRSVDALANMVSPHGQVATTSHNAAVILNLPTQSTPFIGRESELAQIVELLHQPDCHLLTLVGTGGIGKTRLAVEAARSLSSSFVHGVLFVSLAAVTDAALIPASIATSLRLTLAGPPETQLVAYLRSRTMLLVLDNCEQFADGVGWFSELLANAPNVKLLVTSRERLQLAEEWTLVINELPLSEAVALFTQTARRSLPAFELAEQEASVAAICALVENLPLAIELAAAWISFMTCAQIAEHIQRDIDFLAANVRNVPERHRSIRAVFDHSWLLLSPYEQQLMMKLSVFRGGWTIEEAEGVSGATLNQLRTLVDKSLVRVSGEGRYDLHELVRQYAADQLLASGQEVAVKEQHCTVYLALAGRYDAQLYGPHGVDAFARLHQEQDNLRAGMSWAIETGEMDIARQYVDKLFLYWQRRGYWAEGERWAKAVGPKPGEGDSKLLCLVLLDTAVFVALQGRYNEAFLYKPPAEAMARRLEDPETMMVFYFVEGQATLDISTAAVVWEQFFSIGADIEVLSKGGMAKDAMVAGGHFLFGDRLRDAGHNAEAVAHYHQSLELYRHLGNVDLIAYPIGNLGRVALQEGRVKEAYNRFVESVTISRAIGNRVGIADWLKQLGNAALVMGDLSQAESCYEEALALYQEMGNLRACPDVLADLGHTALVRGDGYNARHYLRESLSAYLKFAQMMEPLGIGWSAMLPPEFRLCLRATALLDVTEGRFDRALTLFSATDRLQSKFGYGADLGMQVRVEEALNTIESHLPSETCARVREDAQFIPIQTLMSYALETL